MTWAAWVHLPGRFGTIYLAHLGTPVPIISYFSLIIIVNLYR